MKTPFFGAVLGGLAFQGFNGVSRGFGDFISVFERFKEFKSLNGSRCDFWGVFKGLRDVSGALTILCLTLRTLADVVYSLDEK